MTRPRASSGVLGGSSTLLARPRRLPEASSRVLRGFLEGYLRRARGFLVGWLDGWLVGPSAFLFGPTDQTTNRDRRAVALARGFPINAASAAISSQTKTHMVSNGLSA
jgi:hypothetical protein